MGLRRRASFVREHVDDYDAFHFNFARSLAGVQIAGHLFTELQWLKRRGKTVLATFLGSDARPPENCPCGNSECPCFDEAPDRKRRANAMIEAADRIFYTNPDLRHYLPESARFILYPNVDPRAIEPVPPSTGSGERDELIVAHAPTHRGIKGTDKIIEVVDRLRADGVGLRLELHEGVSRDEVVERCRDADIVVDQLRLGWYGVFAAEMMALGKPVLTYIREDEPADNPLGDELPVIRTAPATLADDLRAIAADPQRRVEVGAAGRAFVETHHDPPAIARSMLEGLVELPREPAFVSG